MIIQARFFRDRRTSRVKAAAALRRAALRSCDRIGLLVEAGAVRRVPVASGRLKQSIYKTDAEYGAGGASCIVGASAGHAIYVEEGFTGHFVPFHIADGLYFEAVSQWGWRVPAPGVVKNPKPGRRYLMPRGKSYAVWGVFVSGKAQPFLKPALDDVTATKALPIMAEEYNKALASL